MASNVDHGLYLPTNCCWRQIRRLHSNHVKLVRKDPPPTPSIQAPPPTPSIQAEELLINHCSMLSDEPGIKKLIWEFMGPWFSFDVRAFTERLTFRCGGQLATVPVFRCAQLATDFDRRSAVMRESRIIASAGYCSA